ncbi:MAG: 1-phosphofructokinase family hexose kinase [Burkholderiaceae bacterium]|nr:1-phosphofructokinase family hexose kinase [Burkholderiaceae bacterium]
MSTTFLTLTLNPALDIATRTGQVQPTHKLRCSAPQYYPGGGGINVARVLHRLGSPTTAWYLAGGCSGAQLHTLLQAEGVPTLPQPIAGQIRENLSVLERSTGQEFRFVLPGPTVLATEWQACLDQLAALNPAPDWLVASGSLPPGVPDDFYARLAKQAQARGQRLVLDTSGPALAAALRAGVYLVKPSLRELRELTGLALEQPVQWQAAAQSLVHQGQTDMVALSLGEQGAVLASASGIWQAPALPVSATGGTTGAGDCFLAALVWALAQGHPPAQALAWAVAGGAAALLSGGTKLAQADDIARLQPQVTICYLDKLF